MLGDQHTVVRIGSNDGDSTPNLDALGAAIDKGTAFITLSHVTFKSGFLYDMATITKLAHSKGAWVLLDFSHSAGAVPVALDAGKVDFVIGCTYKYLIWGPGSPAFLYVSKNLQEQAVSPIWGWWGQKEPFVFGLDYMPAQGITRFLTGSQPIASLLAMEAALDRLLEAGMEALRSKSLGLSKYIIHIAGEFLAPLGFSFGSPRKSGQRRSHVSLRHPEGYRINRTLIEEMNMIPHFREPDDLRLGLTPLYRTFREIWEGIDRIRRTVIEKCYMKYPTRRLTVT